MGKIHERQLEHPIPTISLGKFFLDHLRKNGDQVFMVNAIIFV